MKRHLLYGPVVSRRLGRSLGIDILPHKVCSYDCIYCQLGRTDDTSIERKAYLPADTIMRQLRQRLKQGLNADYMTLGGSGEPLLNTEIASVIHEIKQLTDIPVAVLTNGSLLNDSAARQSILEADVVVPSLDAHNQKMFEMINRPHPDIRFETMVDGLISFQQEYTGEIWLEVFVLEGINATEADAIEFRRWIDRINPRKVHVNTAVRPTAERYAQQVSDDNMALFCAKLGQKAEVITPCASGKRGEAGGYVRQDVLDLLARRPCSLDDICLALNASKDEILGLLEVLSKSNAIDTVKKASVVYYQLGRDK